MQERKSFALQQSKERSSSAVDIPMTTLGVSETCEITWERIMIESQASFSWQGRANPMKSDASKTRQSLVRTFEDVLHLWDLFESYPRDRC